MYGKCIKTEVPYDSGKTGDFDRDVPVIRQIVFSWRLTTSGKSSTMKMIKLEMN